MKLTSWGKYPLIETTLASPANEALALAALEGGGALIGRGLGRSYGDSALNDHLVLSSLRLNFIESFDEESGVLVAGAGVSLAEILDAFVPRGWFLPVTPGTKFVSLGGAVASDVHGKDHHVAATFSRHVEWLDLWTPATGLIRCSDTENSDIFHATAGAHGLTGFILRVALRLQKIPSAFIKQKMVKTGNLDAIMDTFERYAGLPFTVAWIDCLQSGKGLGRSIFMGGSFAEKEELPARYRLRPYQPPSPKALAVPFDFPSFALNSFSVKAFNAFYYGKAPKELKKSIVSYNSFFYPLDSIHNWNRIYGRRGFTQYQFVLPKETSVFGLADILKTIAESGQGSFLAVLKLFGKQPVFDGNISFPMRGYTLALDFPITKKLFPLLDRLDAMVLECGGRHYLTKDARMSGEVLRRGYGPALGDFLAIKKRLDPEGRFVSLQARRLGLV
ncbi:MAG TPA: FAD-linked oxidase [Desulfobulbaceae bacterium]|nr:FAD-linked oxidase [Desulfobulbaceae bacterium]